MQTVTATEICLICFPCWRLTQEYHVQETFARHGTQPFHFIGNATAVLRGPAPAARPCWGVGDSQEGSPAPPPSRFLPRPPWGPGRLLPVSALRAVQRKTLFAEFGEFFHAPCHTNTGLGTVTTIDVNYNRGKTALRCHSADAVITNVSHKHPCRRPAVRFIHHTCF